ncbi:MAG: hypothetical protein QW101_03600 [Ignisphaera sp.]|uniref:Uncharacterized protein n=1 Tax=Ignisphaera aggregans TaxID=334771 RepID=A0A7J3N039_9CREN
MFVTLEDLAICVYSLCEDNFSSIKEYIDCIPESLYTLHNIADVIGIKIRFSTVSALREYVKPITNLREQEIDQILTYMKNIIKGRDVIQSSKSILKILLGREIDIDRNEQDIIEITISALYTSLINTIDFPQTYSTFIEQQPIETISSTATTIT